MTTRTSLGFVTATFSLSLAVFAGLLGPSLKAADWIGFRGPTGQGTSAERGLPLTWSENENITWKTELPGAGTSTPVIIGKHIYLTCYSGFNVPGAESSRMEDLQRHLVCLDRAQGKILWTKDIEAKLPEQDNIRDAHGYTSSTLAADDKRLYAFFGKSGVVAFDFQGKQLWQADVGDGLHEWGSATSPVLHGDLVFVNASVESQSLVALDKATGQEKWRAEGINESWNTPILVEAAKGKTELVVAIQGKILGFNPKSGEQLWSCNTDIGWYMVPSLVADKGVVYCVGGRSGGALAVKAGGKGDVTETHRVWTGKKGSNVTSPLFHDGHIYWMNDNAGIAYCANAKTGELVYEERVPGAEQTYASPLLADGKIYQVARHGKVFVIAAKPEFELLAENDFGERGMYNSGFSVADGQLFLRNDKHLYCVGTAKAPTKSTTKKKPAAKKPATKKPAPNDD